MISKENIKHFRKVTREDSNFLCKLELMDYSVFLVKLTLSKEEAIDIFGEEIRQKQDNAYNELIISESINSTEEDKHLGSDDSNLKMNETIQPRFSARGDGKMHETKYYKQYLFPSLTPGSAYILAIIDYFQMFNFYKYVESGLKTKFSKNAEGVSCVDPETYSKRFIKYFETLTDIKGLFKNNSNNDDNNNSNINFDNNKKENKQTSLPLNGTNIELQSFS